MSWFVYIAKCNDGSLYTGITTDLERREGEHNGKGTRGAKSLRGKRPVVMIYSESRKTQSEARIREAEIKHWKRERKLRLTQGVVEMKE